MIWEVGGKIRWLPANLLKLMMMYLSGIHINNVIVCFDILKCIWKENIILILFVLCWLGMCNKWIGTQISDAQNISSDNIIVA